MATEILPPLHSLYLWPFLSTELQPPGRCCGAVMELRNCTYLWTQYSAISSAISLNDTAKILLLLCMIDLECKRTCTWLLTLVKFQIFAYQISVQNRRKLLDERLNVFRQDNKSSCFLLNTTMTCMTENLSRTNSCLIPLHLHPLIWCQAAKSND